MSHCARLIDHACSRTLKQLNIREGISGSHNGSNRFLSADGRLLQLGEDTILLDPSRNVPLKIYMAEQSELLLLSQPEWKAPLRLNQREQSVRSQQGTVLLLGRSGTGKTLCVIDRMIHDRKVENRVADFDGPGFKQLFVTRSSALCDFVRIYQEHNCAEQDLTHTQFLSFDSFLSKLESRAELLLSHNITSSPSSSPSSSSSAFADRCERSKRVDYQRFRDTVYPMLLAQQQQSKSSRRSASAPVDVLVVWTQIRSFIKGSIEAALEGEGGRGVLSREAYLNRDKFSKDRCRLLPEQREEVYGIFLQYQELHKLNGWWDDMDRAMHLLLTLLPSVRNLGTGTGSGVTTEGAMTGDSGGSLCEKLYVDEVQDNTQAEIALYFVAAGFRVDALFLAGDPAQSVVEGVEFRFEEVRSLVYQLSQSQEALQRPTKLTVNYRSHSGILNCAAGILGKMLAMFPGAAKTLPSDEGLFTGPRPAYCTVQGDADIRRLLAANERLVVICPDEIATSVVALLSSADGTGTGNGNGAVTSNFVLGIRKSKGLEFTDIILLDFFCSIPNSDYKAWKELLEANDHTAAATTTGAVSVDSQYQYAHPQLEPQLKLLYTAVTRCINRLVFVESRKSRIGGIFFRWLKRMELADSFAFPSADPAQLVTDSVSEVSVEGVGTFTLMTRDEWKMRGIDFALTAGSSSDNSDTSSAQRFEQAAYCFQRAGDSSLRSIALACQQLELVKHTYFHDLLGQERPLVSTEEVEIANVLQRCLRLSLIQECKQLCLSVESRLSVHSKKLFNAEIVRKYC